MSQSVDRTRQPEFSRTEQTLLQLVSRWLLTGTIGYDFFISFSRGKQPAITNPLPSSELIEEYVKSLEDKLEKRGYACFRDEREILSGELIDKRIDYGLSSCRAIIAIASKNADQHLDLKSDEPTEGWVKWEIDRAKAIHSKRRFVFFRQAPIVIPIVFKDGAEANPKFEEELERLGLATTTNVARESRENFVRGTVSDEVVSRISSLSRRLHARQIAMFVLTLTGLCLLLGFWIYVDARADNLKIAFQDGVRNGIEPRDIASQFQVDKLAGWLAHWKLKSLNAQNLRSIRRGTPTDDDKFSAQVRETSSGLLIDFLYVYPFWTIRSKNLFSIIKEDPDPTLRLQLIHDIATHTVSFEVLLGELDRLSCSANADEAGTRQFLVLALGAAERAKVPEHLKGALVDTLQKLFSNDPDPGVHSAARWALSSKWGKEEWVVRRERDLAGCHEDQKLLNQLLGPRKKLNPRRWYVMRIDLKNHTDGIVTMIVPKGQKINGAVTSLCATEMIYPDWTPLTAMSDFAEVPDRISIADLSPRQEAALRDGMQRKGFRLPMRSEWQALLLSASNGREFCGRNRNLISELGQLAPKSAGPDGEPELRQIASCPPSPEGFFDLIGNAAECCIEHECQQSQPPVWKYFGLSAFDDPRSFRSGESVKVSNSRGMYRGFRLARGIILPKELSHVSHF